MADTETAPAPSGPTRAARPAGSRPGTQYMAASPTGPVNPSLDRTTAPEYENNPPVEEVSEEPSPESQGPTRANARVARPGTTIVTSGSAPIRPPGGGLSAKELELIENDKKAASQFESLSVSAHDMLALNSTDEIYEKSQFVKTFRTKLNNLHVLQQLFVAMGDPMKSKLFGPVSSGLGEDRITALHNKMLCAAVQLVTKNSTQETHEMVFRHDILDLYYTEVLQAPPPVNELVAHYMREVINSLLKSQPGKVLSFLAGNIPGKSESRGSLLWNHFYCDNLAYLLDELLTAEDTYAKTQPPPQKGPGGPPSRGGPPPGRGGPPGGRGGPPPAGRGGPPPGGRGGPAPAGRGGPGGPPRGGPGGPPPGGRGGPSPAGRGGPSQRGGPRPGGAPQFTDFRWSKRFDLVDEIMKQFNGTYESVSPDTDPMVVIRSQSRANNSAHVFQGLFYRGMDHPSITKILAALPSIVSYVIDSKWLGPDVFESRVKGLTAILRYLNKEWNPGSPKFSVIEPTTDELIRDHLCKGKIYKALVEPPKETRPELLKIFHSLKTRDTVGAFRIRLLQFFSFVLLTKFLDRYEQDIIQANILGTTLDLFFAHQHNFFLHEMIAKTVLINALKCTSNPILKHLFVDCKLLERIMEHWQPLEKSRSSDPASYVSYNGHLLFLANTIRDGNYIQNAQLDALVPLAKWNQFFNTEIDKFNRVVNS